MGSHCAIKATLFCVAITLATAQAKATTATPDEMSTYVAYFLTAVNTCNASLRDPNVSINQYFSRWHVHVNDYLPNGTYEPLVEQKITNVSNFLRSMGLSSGCRTIIDNVKTIFPGLLE